MKLTRTKKEEMAEDWGSISTVAMGWFSGIFLMEIFLIQYEGLSLGIFIWATFIMFEIYFSMMNGEMKRKQEVLQKKMNIEKMVFAVVNVDKKQHLKIIKEDCADIYEMDRVMIL